MFKSFFERLDSRKLSKQPAQTKQAINKIVAAVDYERIIPTMQVLGWRYANASQSPTKQELKQTVKALATSLLDKSQKISGISSGGFDLTKYKDEDGKSIVKVDFVVTYSEVEI